MTSKEETRKPITYYITEPSTKHRDMYIDATSTDASDTHSDTHSTNNTVKKARKVPLDFNKCKRAIALVMSYDDSSDDTIKIKYGSSIFTKTKPNECVKKSTIKHSANKRFNKYPVVFDVPKTPEYDAAENKLDYVATVTRKKMFTSGVRNRTKNVSV